MINPQAENYAAIMFTASVDDNSARQLLSKIIEAKKSGKAGVWVAIQSPGGAPGAARFVYECLRSFRFPAVGHVINAFSEAACLAAAFPRRTIAPSGKIGFHQANMNLTAGQYAEGKISDLLQQVIGHNRAMAAHLQESLDVKEEIVRSWLYEGRVYVGNEAKEAAIVHDVVIPQLDRPEEIYMLNG